MVKETDKVVKKKVSSKKDSNGEIKNSTTKKNSKNMSKKVVKKKPRVVLEDGKVILNKKTRFKEKTIIMKPITDDMVKETKSKEDVNEKTKANNRFEIIVCVVVGLVFFALLFGAINSYIFIPATMICFALELFCICYHLVDRPDKKALVYTLFIIGLIFVILAVVYTIVKTS